MKWIKHEPIYHNAGEEYVRTFFAWLPVKTATHWVWLEMVTERGTWQPMHDGVGFGWMEREPDGREITPCP